MAKKKCIRQQEEENLQLLESDYSEQEEIVVNKKDLGCTSDLKFLRTRLRETF